MVSPEAPVNYDPDAWRAYLKTLEGWPDYPWRADDIARTKETLAYIERLLAKTGAIPSTDHMLRRAAHQFRKNAP